MTGASRYLIRYQTWHRFQLTSHSIQNLAQVPADISFDTKLGIRSSWYLIRYQTWHRFQLMSHSIAHLAPVPADILLDTKLGTGSNWCLIRYQTWHRFQQISHSIPQLAPVPADISFGKKFGTSSSSSSFFSYFLIHITERIQRNDRPEEIWFDGGEHLWEFWCWLPYSSLFSRTSSKPYFDSLIPFKPLQSVATCVFGRLLNVHLKYPEYK
jgi:hypothetical protein